MSNPFGDSNWRAMTREPEARHLVAGPDRPIRAGNRSEQTAQGTRQNERRPVTSSATSMVARAFHQSQGRSEFCRCAESVSEANGPIRLAAARGSRLNRARWSRDAVASTSAVEEIRKPARHGRLPGGIRHTVAADSAG